MICPVVCTFVSHLVIFHRIADKYKMFNMKAYKYKVYDCLWHTNLIDFPDPKQLKQTLAMAINQTI